jgi:hypothetical protein
MSLLFLESFDSYTADPGGGIPLKWTHGAGWVAPEYGRHGQGMRGTAGVVLPTVAHNRVIMGTAVRSATNAFSATGFAWIADKGSKIFEVVMWPDGTLAAWALGGGTGVIQSSPGLLAVLAWYFIEIQADIFQRDAGGGQVFYDIRNVRIWVDGSRVIDVPGTACSTSARSPLGGVPSPYGWNEAGVGTDTNYVFDDVYVLDGVDAAPGWIAGDPRHFDHPTGDVQLRPYYPAAPGDLTQWTPFPFGFANWQTVSEHPPDGDASRNSATALNLADLFALDPVDTNNGLIAVQQVTMARRSEQNFGSIRSLSKYNGAVVQGPEHILPSSYLYFRDLYPFAPDGSVWTDEKINAWQLGYINTVPTKLLSPPVSLTVNQVAGSAGTSQLALAWQNDNAGDAINVYRYSVATDWVFLTTLPAGTTAHTDSGLEENTTYTYTLRHTRMGAESGNSNFAANTTLQGLRPPFNLTVSPVAGQTSQLRLDWTNVNNSDLLDVYRDGAYVGQLPAGYTAWVDTGLAIGTTYTYFLRHWRDGVESTNSNVASNTTLGPPAPPFNVSAQIASDSSLLATWANADVATTEIVVNGAYWTTVGEGVTSYLISGLQRATDYSIQLRHSKLGLYSAYSAPVGGRPRVVANGGNIRDEGGFRYHFGTDDFVFSVIAGGAISYRGFSQGGNGGAGMWTGGTADEPDGFAGGGGGAGGNYFAANDSIEPGGNGVTGIDYPVQVGSPRNNGWTTYRSESAPAANYGTNGNFYPPAPGTDVGWGGFGGSNNHFPGGFGGRQGMGNSNGGGGGAGAGGPGESQIEGPPAPAPPSPGNGNVANIGGPGGPGIFVPIFGTVCTGGRGGRGPGSGANATQWGDGGAGGGDEQGGGRGFQGGFVAWYPL